jgi:hypothetical protein
MTTTYYSSKLTLGDSVSLYTDPALTILAPDGYYSVDGISRRQLGGVLLTEAACAPCPQNDYTVLSLKKYTADIEDSYFTFELTNSVPFNIQISNARVNIYSSLNNCNLSGTPDNQDIADVCVLTSGTNTVISNGASGILCADLSEDYYRAVDSFNVNILGINYNDLNNGDKISIGGIDVYIQIYPICARVNADCTVYTIDACYDLDSVVDACCDCKTKAYEIDLCVASTGCLACTECI